MRKLKNGTVLYECSKGCAFITLNRPNVKNAINLEMHEDLQLAFLKAKEAEDVKVIVLQGKDGAFSSGADLKSIPIDEMASFDHGEYLKNTYNKLIELISSINKPIIAYINGIAVGAGLSLALACDFRFASSDAKMAISFLNIGLVPDAGASYFLPRIVGIQKAIELCLGEAFNSEEALRIGLINNIGDPSAFVEKLKSVPITAYGLMKKNMYSSYDQSLLEVLEMEVESQRIAGKSNEHVNAIKAFITKN